MLHGRGEVALRGVRTDARQSRVPDAVERVCGTKSIE